jgi:hypothetical protein
MPLTSLTSSSAVRSGALTRSWKVRMAACAPSLRLWTHWLSHTASLSLSVCHAVDLGSRRVDDGAPVHVLNLDIKDTHEDASVGADLILKLCRMVRAARACVCVCAHACISFCVGVHVCVCVCMFISPWTLSLSLCVADDVGAPRSRARTTWTMTCSKS